jgi:hypothetical protein
LALPAACVVALSAISTAASAQIIVNAPLQTCGATTPGPADPPPICTVADATRVSTGDTCGFERGATGCTANDFIATASVTTNTLPACTLGESVPGQSLIFQIQSSQSVRYSPGLFIAEQGQDLSVATPPGDTCTVATFPTTNTETPARVPFPWFAANPGDFCGSYQSSFTSVEEVDGITIKCEPGPDGIHPAINFMIVYAQNSNGASACTGPGNVAPGTSSKCGTTSAPITNIVIQYEANPTCSFGQDGFTRDNVANTFTKKFTITNNGPDDAGLAGAGNVSFTDPVPAPFTVTGVSCGNPQGSAACGAAGNFTFSGNNVSGTIDTLPNGGSVDITITGTFPAGDQSSFDNIVTLAVNTDNIITPAEWANTCNVTGTLPVKLQKFDVQ